MDPLKHDDAEETCVICLCTVEERAVTSCNHSAFDFLCLLSWLQERSNCPLCKAEVTAVTYQHTSPSEYKTYYVRSTATPSTSAQSHGTRPAQRSALPRRPRSNRRPYSPPRIDVALLRRRHVYRRNLYSLHVGSNPLSGYQDITPQMVSSSPELQSRARMWIRRELRVFSFLHTERPGTTPADAATTSSNAEFLLMYLISVLKTIDIKGSDGKAEDLLQEFLGREHARLFLHELHSWLRSPFTTLEEWDRNVQYGEQLPGHFDEQGRATLTRREKDDDEAPTATSRGTPRIPTPHEPE